MTKFIKPDTQFIHRRNVSYPLTLPWLSTKTGKNSWQRSDYSQTLCKKIFPQTKTVIPNTRFSTLHLLLQNLKPKATGEILFCC